MLKVALTGGIGTGKSYVLARFHDLHVPTIDADHLVHDALRAGSPVIREIAARFGPGILTAQGDVDRLSLAVVAFGDRAARADLESILHPRVYRAIADWFSGLSGDPAAWMGIADIPLLYETSREAEFDVVIVTACDPETQIRRVMARDDATEDEARRRLAAQWPIAEKAQRSEYVIWTGGSYEETDRQVLDVYEKLKEREAKADTR
jgi:dephospho-CoA kinase